MVSTKSITKVFLATGFAMALTSAPVNAASTNITVCGGSPGGLWSLLGAGLDAAYKQAVPGSTITYQTSSGGYANIAQVTAGKCELGIIHVGEGVIANAGRAPFKAPITGFRTLMVLYDWAPMQWIMTKAFSDKHGIKSLADIAAKKPPLRLVLNRRGILPSQLGEASLAALGVSFEDIKEWGGKLEFQGSKNASEIMVNRRADMWANATFIGSGKIRKIAKAVPITLLNVPSDVVGEMVKSFGAKPTVVKAGAYPWLSSDITTHAARAILIVKDTMSADAAYKLVKALIDHGAKVQAVHKAMKGFTPALMASLGELPYHKGALKAYKEAGLK